MGIDSDQQETPGGRVVIVSPHLDDAVLSLGALISAFRRGGRAVTVLTVFAGGPVGTLSAAAIEDRTRYNGEDPLPLRWAEDDEAARVLDFEPRRIHLPELLFRRRPDGRPRCESLDDIFGPLQHTDKLTVANVATAISYALERLQPDRLFLPLAVGKHVDHAIVRRAASALKMPLSAPQVFYYQDMPYVLRGDKARRPQRSRQADWTVTDEDVAKWFDGIAAYQTQVPILFEDSDWRQAFRDWLASGGGYSFAVS